MITEWFTQETTVLEWFGATQGTLAAVQDQGMSAVASVIGPTGLQGDQGIQGIQGETGATGQAGTSFTPDASGVTASKSIYDDEDTNFAFLDLTTSLIYFKASTTSADWSAGVLFSEKGDAATLAVGTVSTGNPGSSVIVSNVGTPDAAILDITIPRGDVGAQGDQGIQGIQGVQGDPGTNGTNGSDGADGADSDMLQSTYDSNGDGKVDAADSADSVEWANVQSKPSTFPSDTDPVAMAILFGS